MRLPPPLNWLWKGWMAFSHALGRVMSFLLLTVLWVLGFGLYACLGKIIGLTRQSLPASDSAWIDVPPLAPDHLQRQF